MVSAASPPERGVISTNLRNRTATSEGAAPPEAPHSALEVPCPLIPTSNFSQSLPPNLVHQLVPFLPIGFGTRPGQLHHRFPPAPDNALPPWTRWHEQWYRVFHPRVWEALVYDQERDMDCLMRSLDARDWNLARAEETGDQKCVRRAVELQKMAKTVCMRQAKRMLGVLALHAARVRYLRLQRKTRPQHSVEQILQDLPVGSKALLPSQPTHSVWPFTVAFSSSLPPPFAFTVFGQSPAPPPYSPTRSSRRSSFAEDFEPKYEDVRLPDIEGLGSSKSRRGGTRECARRTSGGDELPPYSDVPPTVFPRSG